VEFEICEKCGRAIAKGSEFYYNKKILCEKCFIEELENSAEAAEAASAKPKIVLVTNHRSPKVQKIHKVPCHPFIEDLLKLVKVD